MKIPDGMDILLFSNAWHEQALARQIAWGVASVSTVLLVIFAALSIFGKPEPNAPPKAAFSVRFLLPFITFGTWGLLVSFYHHLSLPVCISAGIGSGLTGIVASRFFVRLTRQVLIRDHFDLHSADQSTGKALKTIPPHRNGFGSVHLNVREAPFAVEAVTSGKAISPGTPVRVVGIIDEKVVLVEPIDEDGPASPLSP